MLTTHGRDRVAAAAGALIVVALLGLVLVFGLRVTAIAGAGEAIMLVTVKTPPPPPPPRVTEKRQKPHARTARAPSPRNLRNKATPVVAPPPIVIPPKPPPIVVAPRPGTGAAASSGASDRPGPGQGAGGRGDGDGGGGDGGDGDGDFTPPRLRRGDMTASDLPETLRRTGVPRPVAIRYYVNVDGRVSGCTVTTSSGNAEFDRLTCALAERRFRYDPSRDPDGRPVRSVVVDTYGIHAEHVEDDPER